ncbi:MAG: efflux RND transporter periplasmic adaptor subunit [Pseudomonadota bacterium]
MSIFFTAPRPLVASIPQFALVFFALAAVSFLSSRALAQGPAATVMTASVTRESAAPTARLPGTVISTRDARVRSEISGRVLWVAQVGEEIAAGEPLVRLDDRVLELEQRRNLAQIARLEADIAVRERQRGRLAHLAEENNMAEFELDQVEADLEMLRQDLAMAKVDRERTAYDLERSQLPAPFGGIVVERSLTEGEYANAGEVIIRLVDPDALEISVPAPLRIARFNRSGSNVSVTSDGVQTIEEIRSVVPVGDSQSRMMELRIALDQTNYLIGEAVTVALPQAEPVAMLTIPRDALVLRDREQYIYAVDDDSKARKVHVQTTGGHGERVAVEPLSGELEPGATVIVRGAENLREGQDVRVLSSPLAVS